MRSSFLLVVLFYFGCQTQQPDYVVTRGFATVKVPVDYVTVSVSVTKRADALKTAYQRNQDLIIKVLDVIKSFSIADSDFVTVRSDTRDASSDARFAYARSDQKPALEAVYEARLTLRSLDRYDEIARALLDLGNLEISVLSFHSNTIDSYQKQAYAKAFQNAREHAAEMLAGSQRKLGKLIKLLQDDRDYFTKYDNIEEPQSIYYPSEAQVRLPEVAESREKGPVTFRRKVFDQNATVTAIFELD